MALVVDESSAFARKVPVILGTLMLHRVVNCMKESEMEKAPPEWENIRMGLQDAPPAAVIPGQLQT